MNIVEKLISEDKYTLKCPYSMTPKYITIHNTGNKASAENEIAYMQRNDSSTSFHIAVDDKVAILGIPLNRNAWHCGDSNGKGNRESIGVEICYSTSNAEQFRKAELHAIEVVKWLMQNFNIPIENVVPHKKWSGKDCPHKTDMNWFISQLKTQKVGQCCQTLNTTKDDVYTKAVNKLVEKGVISSPKVWLDDKFTTDNVHSLIIKIGNKL